MARKSNTEPTGHRIGWLDSVRHPSKIHRTVDGGKTTICGWDIEKTVAQQVEWYGKMVPRWVVQAEVPRTHKGRSCYCKTCFAHGGKTLPWHQP